MSGDVRGELAEALAQAGEPWPGAPNPRVIAERIAPVVERIAREAAAEALRKAADGYAVANWREWAVPCTDLRARADRLIASADALDADQ